MADGYKVPKSGLEALVEKFAVIERQVNALRSSAGILSAIIGKGGITVKDGGEIIAEGGNIRAVDATTKNVLAYFGRLLPPYKSGLLTATAAGAPFFWAAVMEDGTRVFNFGGTSFTVNVGTHTVTATSSQTTTTSHRTDTSTSYVNASSYHRVDAADYIMLNAPQLRLYQLPTTGAAANVRLETATGTPVLQFVTSSRRYKTDIQDAAIDPLEVLQLRPRVWRDKGEVERDGDDARTNIGFIAEEVDELESLRHVVDYNADGVPDALQYERIPAGLVVLAQHQAEQIADLKQQNAEILARLTALESN